ncbi:MAG TPA: cell division protein FtsZ [Dehalococcoidia bacterium]|nr:cell division protein FtsZ [Dehalococcoidia bacterium]
MRNSAVKPSRKQDSGAGDSEYLPLGKASTDEEWERAPARIKVVGVGGGGCNTVRRMMQQQVRGVQYVMCNTDIKSLEQAGKREGLRLVQLGPKSTRGWGAGGRPMLGEQAAEESASELRDALKNAELVFVTAGMGGGTGTGAAPYVSHLAKQMGALVVGVVTTPFSFEGKKRMGDAISGIRRLRPYMSNLVVIHNDRLLQYVSHDAEMLEAFKTADEVVTQGILSISQLINEPGEINVDFADVQTIMGHPGGAIMAIGEGKGKNGTVDAALQALTNPLLNLSINGAKGVLFSVKGGHEVTLGGVNEAGKIIRKAVDSKAHIFFGMNVDHNMEGSIKLTMIATGLKEDTWLSAMTDTGAISRGVKNLVPGQSGPKRSGFLGLRKKAG